MEGNKKVYTPDQFARFAPQTTLDVVTQIPGFQITEVSGDRGLGEASQNILINGQRITGKGNDAETILSRSPVASLIRIEIADAATFNISGINGQVANIVTKTGKLSGNFVWRPEFRPRQDPNLLWAEANIAGKIGSTDFTLGINNTDSFRNGYWGPEDRVDGDGNLLFTRKRSNRYYGDRPRISGTLARTAANGSIFNANAAAEFYRFRRSENATQLSPNVSNPNISNPNISNPNISNLSIHNITEIGRGVENEWNAELGADYEFNALGGRLKLIGYGRYEHSPTSSSFRTDYDDGVTPSTGSIFDRMISEGESVARAEYRWKAGKADWQLSAEGAYNVLDAKADLFELDSNGVFQPAALDGASSKVEEKRGQVILSYARPLSSALHLQTSMGGEYSQLTQSGDNNLSRTFFRPKGSAILAWKTSPRLNASLKLERKVGQLNFGDFLASIDLQDNTNNGSNAKLRPPQSWLAELEVNRSLGAAGSLKLQIEAEAISDPVDQIALSTSTEAPGNLDSTAQRLRAKFTAAFILDAIGFTGAQLDTSLALQTTSVTDDLGIRRPLSDRERYGWKVDFRHDIPGTQWAWGLGAEDDRNTVFYRLDYTYRETPKGGPFTFAFLEHKDVLGLKLRFNVLNILNRKDTSTETFYKNRRDGDIDYTQRGIAEYGRFYRIRFSGTF